MNFDLDDIYKLAALFFSGLIFLNGYFVARLAKTWLLPGSMISFFWFGYTFFPLLGLYSVPISPLAIFYIFVAIFMFSLPSYFFNWRSAFRKNQQKWTLGNRFEFHTRFLFNIFFLMQILVIVTLFLDVVAQGFSIKSIFFNLMETSSEYISLRYSDGLNVTLLSRVGTVFMYVGVMLGGLIFSTMRVPFAKYLVIFLSLFPSIIVMVVQGAKGAIFLCVVFFYSTFLIYRLYSGNLAITDKRINKNILISLVLLLPALISSFLSRGLYGYDFDYVVERLSFYLSSYAFAHLYAFADWFSFYNEDVHIMHYETQKSYSFGLYTFMSIYKLYDPSVVVPPGVYEEYFQYKDVIQTNIYTFFRGLILDFGIFGSLIFMFFAGVITSCSFYTLLKSSTPYISISFFAMMAGFYYSSFIISIFIWNSIFVAFAIFSIILYINRIFFCYKSKALKFGAVA